MIITNVKELLVALGVVCVMGAVGGLLNGWWRAWRGFEHCPSGGKDYCLFAFCGAMSAIGVSALGIVAFPFLF